MRKIYVYLAGPYDQSYVGPFSSLQSAIDYLESQQTATIDAWVINEVQMQRANAKYGYIPATAPANEPR